MKNESPEETSDSPQPFLNHLEELRRRIFACLVWLAAFTIAAAFFVDPVLEWLAKPVGEFIFTSPGEAFFLKFKIAGGVGFILSFPIMMIMIWRFVEVALQRQERSLVVRIVPFSLILFYGGMAIALFGVLPLAVKFLLEFSSPTLRPMISLNSYLSFVLWMILGFGLFFQMPLVILFLTRMGIISVETLARHRRHAFLLILICSGILTPGPDVISLVILAVPSYLLYECSLLISRRWNQNAPE